MMTANEWTEARGFVNEHEGTVELESARKIVEEDFSTFTSRGLLRMRESQYCRAELQLNQFVKELGALFNRVST